MNDPARDEQIQEITRPHRALWTYYLLTAVAFPPVFPFLAPFLFFRFHSMRYRFSDDGISMKWGILFRREVIINYARIQDIHLRSNVVERWLGLARILVQTASGSQGAEMTIEGIREFEALRDFLYDRMRGVKDGASLTPASREGAPTRSADLPADALAAALRDVARELRAVREALARREPRPAQEPRHD